MSDRGSPADKRPRNTQPWAANDQKANTVGESHVMVACALDTSATPSPQAASASTFSIIWKLHKEYSTVRSDMYIKRICLRLRLNR